MALAGPKDGGCASAARGLRPMKHRTNKKVFNFYSLYNGWEMAFSFTGLGVGDWGRAWKWALQFQHFDHAINGVSMFGTGDFQVVLDLQSHPDTRGRAKITRKSEGSIGRYGTHPTHDLADSQWGNADVLGDAVLTQTLALLQPCLVAGSG